MLSKYVRKAPLNSVPWSDRTRAGGPYLQVIFSWNQAARVLLDLFLRDPTSTHLVMGSTTTMACTSPLGPAGVRFVTRSTHH